MLGPEAALVAGLGAFLGHLFPVWLGFKGGKGVATYIGVLLGLAWLAALVFAAIWVAVAAVTRYSSLSGLLASAATPASSGLSASATEASCFSCLALLVFVMHRANIARLLAGTERKIGQGGEAMTRAGGGRRCDLTDGSGSTGCG